MVPGLGPKNMNSPAPDPNRNHASIRMATMCSHSSSFKVTLGDTDLTDRTLTLVSRPADTRLKAGRSATLVAGFDPGKK